MVLVFLGCTRFGWLPRQSRSLFLLESLLFCLLVARGPCLLTYACHCLRLSIFSTFKCRIDKKGTSIAGMLRVRSWINRLHAERMLWIRGVRRYWPFSTVIQEHALVRFLLATCCIECLGRLLRFLLISEIEYFIANGEVAVCGGVLTWLSDWVTIWFIWDWAFLQRYLNLVFTPSLESTFIEEGRFMLAWVNEVFPVRCERFLVGRIQIEHRSILTRLCLCMLNLLIEILRSNCDLWSVRIWWWIIRLEDHCWVDVEISRRWRSVFAY